jgi:5-methyltetrahydrofolate--homocysteine methyltransferase
MKEIKLTEINIAETLSYLGIKSSLPDGKILSAINRCEGVLLDTITPRYVYKITEISHPLLVGNDIKELLHESEKAVFFCCTLGHQTDRLISTAGVTDVANELYFDALANAAIEQVCDKTEKIILSAYPAYKNTMRFSPGYGDFPLSLQSEILTFLNAEKLIGVTNSSMMKPLKSVTAVMGLVKR